MKLTDHFMLGEMTFSETAARRGIDNTPNGEQIAALTYLAERLEEVRLLTGKLRVTSGYRSLDLNTAIGSKPSSQHVKCEAADVQSLVGLPAFELCRLVADSDIEFDQLIYEFGSWMHISFVRNGKPRGSVLTIDGHGTRLGLVED